MKHRHRRSKLTKFADIHGMLAFKILLVILSVVLAGCLIYFVSTFRM
ncbi:MAG: hypothetical protein K9N62_06905 [Verrucomicrobia bacterium]|jgi:hypothetical protein|nr:hypothetical protein [Verrucomicrobiota bacterium]